MTCYEGANFDFFGFSIESNGFKVPCSIVTKPKHFIVVLGVIRPIISNVRFIVTFGLTLAAQKKSCHACFVMKFAILAFILAMANLCASPTGALVPTPLRGAVAARSVMRVRWLRASRPRAPVRKAARRRSFTGRL